MDRHIGVKQHANQVRLATFEDFIYLGSPQKKVIYKIVTIEFHSLALAVFLYLEKGVGFSLQCSAIELIGDFNPATARCQVLCPKGARPIGDLFQKSP